MTQYKQHCVLIIAALVCALLLFASAAVYAHSVLENQNAPNACHLIGTDTERLSCYDAIAHRNAGDLSALDLGQWIPTYATTNQNTNKSRTDLSLPSKKPIGKKNNAELWIVCTAQELAIYIWFAGLSMQDENAEGYITYRTDGSKAKRQAMTTADDRRIAHALGTQALGIWDSSGAAQFIQALVGHTQLFVLARPTFVAPVVVEFDITHIDNALRVLGQKCQNRIK